MSVELSVIIPALNEASTLPALLEQLARQQGVALEIIVVDGGSADGSAALAEHAAVKLVRAPRGRGTQMNAGAREARAPLLLFLHADSGFTSPLQLRDAVARMRAATPDTVGHFSLRFARSEPGRELFYRYLEEKTTLARPNTINGDQGLMIRAEFFRALGGYDERLPFLEDQRLAARIFERGRWVTFATPLITSARRFEKEGTQRRYTLMSLMMGLYVAGAEEWFARAPKVYAQQDQAAHLDVGAYLMLTWEVLADAGWRRAGTILFRAGRFTRQNSWQLFYWWDVLLRRRLGAGRYPCLRFHDRWFTPATNNVVADALTTALITLWFLVVLPPVYAVIDRRDREE